MVKSILESLVAIVFLAYSLAASSAPSTGRDIVVHVTKDGSTFTVEAEFTVAASLDEVWEVIEPLLPKWTPSPKGGHPRLDDRKSLTGILFVLKTCIPWEDLPAEMGCGCGMTCWRRLHAWQEHGVW